MSVKCRVLESGIASITQPYHINGQKGYGYDHWGIDLTGFNGSINVLDWEVAHSDGVVVGVRKDCQGWEEGSYGNYVLLEHANGYRTMYAHMMYGTVQVNFGQHVRKGMRLGYMGNTGHSFGGHLHFEVRRPDGYQIDPEPYINADLPSGAKWLPTVNGYNINDYNNGFAGMYLPCDCLAIKDKNLVYRVKLKDTQKWLPWVYGKNYDLNDHENGYAGIQGRAFDEVEIKTLNGAEVASMAYDTAYKKWLPQVINTNKVNDTIGLKGDACGGVAVKSKTLECYCASIL